jgi:energy-coupling factor transporter ATP-binding protein EcfA2
MAGICPCCKRRKRVNEAKAGKVIEGTNNARLENCSPLNIILGRNGAGKSRFLRAIADMANPATSRTFYISPERAGVFRRDGNLTTHVEQNPGYLEQVRRRNQAENFKAGSAHRLRELRDSYNSKILNTPELRYKSSLSFEASILPRISGLLANIRVESSERGFIFKSPSDQTVEPNDLSSGESEAITLAAEILSFFENIDESMPNTLLLDEPDVHLHPDLQARLGHFILSSLAELKDGQRERTAVCIATHSTALVSSLASSPYTSVGIKNFDDWTVRQVQAKEELRKIAPFFGHPLSLALSEDVMLIVEGEDDERVFQQAGRTSRGRIKLFPVVATSVDQQTELETYCDRVVGALFDNPVAYSLRDGDGKSGAFPDIGVVKRFRLHCYAIENALLTDECLHALGCDSWVTFVAKAKVWLSNNPSNKDARLLDKLIESQDRLRHTKIKGIRDVICSICEKTKPWEVVIGQCLGNLKTATPKSDYSLAAFLGVDAVRILLDLPEATSD